MAISQTSFNTFIATALDPTKYEGWVMAQARTPEELMQRVSTVMQRAGHLLPAGCAHTIEATLNDAELEYNAQVELAKRPSDIRYVVVRESEYLRYTLGKPVK